ncbi:MAG: hypothetical protein RLZZ210_1032 [Pseudomonadota bacterium]|jgi:5-formyltetrahydrofolate cyclo-ligase
MHKSHKSELRKLILSSRQHNIHIDNLINQQLLLLFQELKPTAITAYISIKNEVNILPAIQYCWQQGIAVYVPSVVGKKQPLIFKLWNPDNKLVHGVYGTIEPDNNANTININDMMNIDIMLVPSVGVFIEKSSIYRLGYGGGFYDMTIAGAKGCKSKFKTVAILHNDYVFCDELTTLNKYQQKYQGLCGEICENEIVESHDVTFDMLVTPSFIIR